MQRSSELELLVLLGAGPLLAVVLGGQPLPLAALLGRVLGHHVGQILLGQGSLEEETIDGNLLGV